jgi:hypothetical protein
LRQRLFDNAKVQEGDKPAEKPEDLLKEMEQTAAEFEKLNEIPRGRAARYQKKRDG